MKDETKVKAKDFLDKVKKTFDRGLTASKKALGVAGDAVQDFSDKSVVTIEKKQLESKLKKQYTALGEIAAKTLSKKGSALTSSDENVAEILKEISRLNKEIKAHSDALAEGKTGKAAKTDAKKSVKAVTKKSDEVQAADEKAAKTKKTSTAAPKTAAKKTTKKVEKK